MADHELLPRRLLLDSEFNWVYPVDLVVGLIVTLFFLFYFNRVFGSLVAYALRKYTWYKFHVYIDFQALQFSFLAGRVFFKGFRYHGHNETVLVHDGYITWRYWLRRVKEAECLSLLEQKTNVESGAKLDFGLEENVGKKASDGLPCRIKAKIRGVEWFVYNRSPAYDSILENISGKQPSNDIANDGPVRKRARLNKPNLATTAHRHRFVDSQTEISSSSNSKYGLFEKSQSPQEFEPSPVTSTASSRPQSGVADTQQIGDLPLLLRILPIKLECSKGAIVMGNQHTRSIVTAKFDNAVGNIDAQKSSSPLDRYKQVINLDFAHPVIQLKANRAFTDSQPADAGKHNVGAHHGQDVVPVHKYEESDRHKRSLWSSLRCIMRRFGGADTSFAHKRVINTRASRNGEDVPGEQRWLGLTRYIDDEDDLIEQERWKAVEYGRFETIVDSPGISVSIHWDVPGEVPKAAGMVANAAVGEDINGDNPPDWSIDLRIRGGEIHYGPWADRQRTDLQNAFFPTLYKDAVPASIIPPGNSRISTVLKLMIDVEVATKLVLHTREDSKDWKWKGHPAGDPARDDKTKSKKFRGKKKEKANLSPEIRPYGWLDFQVGPDSTVSFTMDLFARPKGYRNRVELDLREPEMVSSVNHELLWRCKSQSISCDLSNPLEWNALRQWCINVQSDALEVFILRDHIFLLSDLINDWTSGPPGDYYTFVPFKYLINLQLSNFKLYVNANDCNIVNNPTDIDDNTFVVVWGQHLAADLTIPIEHYQPSRNAILFDVDARDGGFELRTPQWNTQHAFLNDNKVASLTELKIHGSYNYALSTSPALTDILLMEIYGDSPRIHLYGFLIRYLMKIKDNYFGEDLHFRTLEEYKAQVAAYGQHGQEAAESTQHSKVTNDLDVVLKISADNSSAVLPSSLYTAGQGINLDIASICGDLRFTNYFMDLGVTFSPISVGYIYPTTSQDPAAHIDSTTQIFIDGLNLYGHRLFGLPPTEPTYVCNWDFDVGSIHGECTAQFLHGLLLGVRCFGFSFDDLENALPPLNPPVVHDVTFLRVKVQPVHVWLSAELAAFRLSMQSVNLNYNDWAGAHFSDKLSIHISELIIAIVDAPAPSIVGAHNRSMKSTQAYLQTTVDLRLLSRKRMFEQYRHLQRGHIKLQDVRTHRTPWLVHDFDQTALQAPPTHQPKIRPPAMQFPLMPEPLTYRHNSSLASYSTSSVSTRSGLSSKKSSRKSSFLTDRIRQTGSPANVTQFEVPDSDHNYLENAHGRPAGPDTLSGPSSIRQRGSLAQPGFTSPSPYKIPYFPLQDFTLDMQDVPAPANQEEKPGRVGRPSEDALELQLQDHSMAKSSIMVDFSPDARALCTPAALRHVVDLLTELQVDTVDTLLDSLQIETMTETSKSIQDSDEHSANIIEFNICMPSLQTRFLSRSTLHPPRLSKYGSLSLNLEKINVAARMSKGRNSKLAGTSSNLLSLHVSLAKVDLSLSSKPGYSPITRRLIGFTVSDIIFWAAKGKMCTASLKFRETDFVVNASQDLNDILPSAFDAAATMMEMAEDKSQMTGRQRARLKLLVLSITVAGEEIPDPPFLTRASYVLRSANNHLRGSDSWKLMARLRHTLNSLPAVLQADITDQCTAQPKACPKDAIARVASSLEHWRAWDAVHVKQSLLMHKVYGASEALKDQVDTAVPVKTSVQGEWLQLTVIAGHSHNSTTIENVEAAVLYNRPAVASGGFIDPETFSVGDAMLQAHCAKISTSLNWDLCELINIALEIPFDQLPVIPRTTPTANAPTKPRKIHLIVSSNSSIVNLVSVNLRTMLLCQGLKASTLLTHSTSRHAANFLISAETATSEVQSHARPVIMSKLQRPSVFCSTDNDTQIAKKDRMWRVAVSCSYISFKILEDPLLLIEVVDLILQDEVTNAMQIAQDVRMRVNPNYHDAPVQVEPAVNKAHVTVCVDNYLLNLTILPSLIYRISGEGARTTVQHGLRKASETFINFDFQEHIHAFRTRNNKASTEIAALHIPPINGRLGFRLGHQQKSIVLNTMIEAMTLEASALHALLVTCMRPEISSLSKSIDREVRSMRSNHQQLFGVADRSGQGSPSEIPVYYDASVLAAGLSVHANSPLSSVSAREGQLDINLGCIQARAANKNRNGGQSSLFPEFRIRLDSIRVGLKRIESANGIASGEIALSAFLKSTSKASHGTETIRAFQLHSSEFNVNMYAETAPMIVDIIGHLQNTLKAIDLTSELRTLRSIRRPRVRSVVGTPLLDGVESTDRSDVGSQFLWGAMYSLEMANIRLGWIIGSSTPMSPGREAEDLILSFSKIDLSTKKDNAARLLLEKFQVQMVPSSKAAMGRSMNSALLPEVVFNVAYLSTGKDRRLAFQAAGKSLDLRLNSKFILPASDVRRSIAFAIQEVRTATADWKASAAEKGNQTRQLLGGKKFASVLVDADFAGAIVYIEGRNVNDRQSTPLSMQDAGTMPQHRHHNQFTPDNATSNTTLRSPGLAFKVEYRNGGIDQESLNAEIKVDASKNILHPTLVPLIMEISSSVKVMMGESEQLEQSPKSKPVARKLGEDDRVRSADPSTIFGKTRVNFGLRICKQEFSLSCQPMAKVAATARFEDIYVSLNTIRSNDHGQFFTISAVFTKPELSVQHAYSREPTGSLSVDSAIVSLMSSKHVSAANGLSIILKISPTRVQVNARQLQDVLLFREIWVPAEMRQAPATPAPHPSDEPQALVVQRYQQVAAAGSFPWDATVSIVQLNVQLDLGQALGRSVFNISNLWVSSKKTSNWEQNLCLGFDRAGIDATGRMSGLVELQAFRIRTSIQWPMADVKYHTPLIQASLGFDHLRVKAAFDYQAFAIMNVTAVAFIMYNVRDLHQATGDRLVAVVEGDSVQVYCTAISASQGLALYQAVQRLIEEKRAAYEVSLKDVERLLRRKSTLNPPLLQQTISRDPASGRDESIKVPIRLQTDVVVKLRAINFGIFPSTFFDNQVFKVEAKDASARFSVAVEHGKIRSTLEMSLGQLRVALSGAARPSTPKKVGEVSIDEVAASATASRGGLILSVPRTLVSMQIWQSPESNHIDYIFRSSFQGNIDVGWNYSRISFIRGMHTSHTRALAQRLGKPLPQSAVQITGGLQHERDDGGHERTVGEQDKITAVVNVPQSKYDYTALEPALVDTPQLRNLGEATPPLEWIGLNRERLPNLTHQIVIVSLLEVAKEVEDAYVKILGSS